MQDISVQAVLAVGSFAGAAATASYVPDYIDARDVLIASHNPIFDPIVSILNSTISSLGATAVSL